MTKAQLLEYAKENGISGGQRRNEQSGHFGRCKESVKEGITWGMR